MPKPGEREIYKRFFVMTKKERVAAGFPENQYEMGDYLHVARETLTKWGRQFRDEGVYPAKNKPSLLNGKNKVKRPPILPHSMEQAVEIASVARGWWTQDKIDAINEAIFKSSIGTGKGNANAQKLAQQLAGELVEKKEIKFVLSAEDYFRIRREAASRIRELPGEPDADRGVLPKSAILLSEDGISTEQEHIQEREVANLAVST